MLTGFGIKYASLLSELDVHEATVITITAATMAVSGFLKILSFIFL
jgi:hypothetical protein